MRFSTIPRSSNPTTMLSLTLQWEEGETSSLRFQLSVFCEDPAAYSIWLVSSLYEGEKHVNGSRSRNFMLQNPLFFSVCPFHWKYYKDCKVSRFCRQYFSCKRICFPGEYPQLPPALFFYLLCLWCIVLKCQLQNSISWIKKTNPWWISTLWRQQRCFCLGAGLNLK